MADALDNADKVLYLHDDYGKIVAKIPVADKLPHDWYDPEEDAVWETYLKDSQ